MSSSEDESVVDDNAIDAVLDDVDEDEEEEEDIYGAPPDLPTVLIIPPEDAPDDGHVDNYEMLDDVNNDYTLSEKMVHYIGAHIVKQHWAACKAVLCFHAGAYVSTLPTMTKENCHEATLKAYHLAIADLDPTHFGPNAIAFFRHMFRDKNKAINGLSVWRYFQTTRHAIRNIILPLFPTDFNAMKSGQGFHQTVKTVMTKEYRKSLLSKKDPMTMEEAEQCTAPSFWEYKQAPWIYTLATKIYRRHVQVAPKVEDVVDDPANATMSKAKQKRLGQWKSHQITKKGCAGSSRTDMSSVIDVDAESNQREKNKRKEATVATTVMSTNLNIRMGQMQQLKESMDFLDRFKSIIGDEEYSARARKLLSCLPDPETFMAEVNSKPLIQIKCETIDDNEEEVE